MTPYPRRHPLYCIQGVSEKKERGIKILHHVHTANCCFMVQRGDHWSFMSPWKIQNLKACTTLYSKCNLTAAKLLCLHWYARYVLIRSRKQWVYICTRRCFFDRPKLSQLLESRRWWNRRRRRAKHLHDAVRPPYPRDLHPRHQLSQARFHQFHAVSASSNSPYALTAVRSVALLDLRRT